MTDVKLNKENVDNIIDLWLPDKELCAEQQEFRAKNEWRRDKYSGIIKPSELGIEKYRYGDILHPNFYSGRTPPQVPMDSVENLEWYEEQLKRCVYGYEYGNQRITGDHYWFLNFTPFLIALKDKNGNPTTNFDTDFPYFSYQHDYIFKLIEEAHSTSKAIMLMGGRGFGKTYMMLSISAKAYYLKPESHNVISGTNSGHAGEAFSKMRDMLRAIDSAHPTLALSRLINTKYFIKSGYEVTRDGVKKEEGPMSKLQCVIYGDNPGVTRGSRPDTFLMEEIGDWASGKANLKACINASEGSWKVGSIFKTRLMMIGTGGSVSTDQAKDLFTNPDAYDILAVKDFPTGKMHKHAVFIPSDYLLGGMGWERTGVNNNEEARKFLNNRRELAKEDMELLDSRTREWPFTIEEVFKRTGTNIFNQRKISKQWVDIELGADHVVKPERGMLEWVRSKGGSIVDVKWSKNPNGNIEIVEHPFRGEKGDRLFNKLYVIGVDSIDQGQLDSTSLKNRSSLAALVKKRIADGGYFTQTSNLYVAKFLGRSLDVRDDYEEVLKLSMYYNGQINLEYTKIGLVHYFREKKQWHRFMKRPQVAMPSADDGSLRRLGVLKNDTLIGTTTSPGVIDHQDGKIKEYINEYCHQIFFRDVLEQLRDYQREDRRKYDLVVAMGLCEIADEDLLGEPAKDERTETENFKQFGYYKDEYGRTQFGVLPASKTLDDEIRMENKMDFSWVDSTGTPRFDKKYDVLDARDL
jgi:hypothetical protein